MIRRDMVLLMADMIRALDDGKMLDFVRDHDLVNDPDKIGELLWSIAEAAGIAEKDKQAWVNVVMADTLAKYGLSASVH